jgi:hypothetical protein
MSYNIEAILSTNILSEKILGLFPDFKIINLSQNIILIPINKGSLTKNESFKLIEGFEYLNDKVFNKLIELSKISRIIYIESEYFGGTGSSSCIVLENGNIIYNEFQNKDAVNNGLKLLNVKKGDNIDEFEALNLGSKRKTEDW